MTSRLRWIARAAAVTLVGGSLAVAAATPAHAADAAVLDVVGSSIYYSAGASQTNHLIIERSTANADQYIFSEVGGAAIMSADPACVYSVPGSASAMTCTAPGVLNLVVSLGAGNDAVLNWTDRGATFYGGDGDDTLWLGGRTGASGWGDGGNGADVVISGPGNDTMIGGSGVDRAAYTDSTASVTASLITFTGGHSYDTDTFNGIENLEGGGGDDTLTGNPGTNHLYGGTATVCRAYPTGCQEISGNDTLHGSGGDDTIVGDTGNDLMLGGDGNDVLWGGRGDDSLLGESGNDTLYGESGTNYLHGGPGTDACWNGTKVFCEN